MNTQISETIDPFFEHLDVCHQCARTPWDMCSVGDHLLEEESIVTAGK